MGSVYSKNRLIDPSITIKDKTKKRITKSNLNLGENFLLESPTARANHATAKNINLGSVINYLPNK